MPKDLCATSLLAMAESETKRRKLTSSFLLEKLQDLDIDGVEKETVAKTLLKVPDDVLCKDSRENLSSYLQKIIQDDTTRLIVVGTLHRRIQDAFPPAPALYLAFFSTAVGLVFFICCVYS